MDTNKILQQRLDNLNKLSKDNPLLWKVLSGNKSITMDIVFNNKDKPWDWKSLSRQIPIKDILKHPELPWQYNKIYADYDEIKDYLHLPWDLTEIKNVPFEYILKNLHLDWNWLVLSWNTSIKIQDVLDNKDLPWHWDILSANPTITVDDMLSHIDLPWSSNEISKRANIQHVLNNPNVSWNYIILTVSNNISFDDIVNSSNLPWNYNIVSQLNSIRIKNVIDNPKLPWNWSYLTANPNISCQDIFDNIHLPWDVSRICDKLLNKSMVNQKQYAVLSFSSIVDNLNIVKILLDNLTIEQILYQTCVFDLILKVKETDRDYIENNAALIIQKYWFKANTNPKYKICQKRLHKEFNALKIEKVNN